MRRKELCFMLVAGAVFLTLYLAGSWRYSAVIDGTRYFALSDDQMISMRYAENLAAGRGLVWNEGERVEGFTNPLWTLYMAAWHWIGLSKAKTSFAISGSGGLLLLGSAVMCALIARRLVSGSFATFALAFVMPLLYWPLVRWTMEGFELGSVAVGTSSAFYFLLRYQETKDTRCCLGLAVALLVVAFTRLEFLPIIGLGFVPALFRGERRRPLLIRVGLPLVAGLILLFVARHAYYGEWFPNTYYLKLTGISLPKRLPRGYEWVLSTIDTHLLLLLSFVVLGLITRTIQRALAPILLAFVASVLYTLYLGGDTWETKHFANRFLSPIVPLVMVVVLTSLSLWRERLATGPRTQQLFVGVAALLIVYSLSAIDFRAWLKADIYKWKLYNMVRAGLFLKDHLPKETRVAVVWAGALPYFSELPCIDLMGKMDKVIARSPPHNPNPGHNKWDLGHSVGQLKPDIIIELYDQAARDKKYVEGQGYELLSSSGWYVRRKSPVYDLLKRSKPF
jgi:hypothetical protein